MRGLTRLFRRGMTCQEVLEMLQAYLDGELEAETAREILAHLDGCTPCVDESATYHRIKMSLHARQIPIDPEIKDALARFGERVARGEIS